MAGYSYEVRTLRDARWVLERIFDSEALATKHARELLTSGRYDGVQVYRERQSSSGSFGTIIMEERSPARPAPRLSIVQSEDIAPCDSLDSVYELDARLTLWRVLRRYFDQTALTPSEVLYNAHALGRLMDHEPPLYAPAVDHIATIQARTSGVDIKARRDELFAWGDRVQTRARSAESHRTLRHHGLSDFPALCAAALKAGGPFDRDLLIRAAIARETWTMRSWLAKLDALLAAAKPDMPRADLAILDGFVADVLASTTAITDLMGNRPSLVAALFSLLDLIEGTIPGAASPGEADISIVMRRLFADGRLPAGRQVVLDRIRGQVASKEPLDRMHPERESEAFKALLDRLSDSNGIVGGPAMAEALTTRTAFQQEAGGVTGRRLAVEQLAMLYRDPLRRLQYLLALAETDTGKQVSDLVVETLTRLVRSADTVRDLVPSGLEVLQVMVVVSGLQRAMMASRLPRAHMATISDRLDVLLAEFVQRDGFIERLDEPTLSLRERAIQLVRFCSCGPLLEGRAKKAARERILVHLRQASFIEKFSDGLSAKDAEQALRAFYGELEMAGFDG